MPPATVTRANRVAAQIFQHPADEIAHVDQRRLGQVVQAGDRRLRGRAGGAGDVVQADGAGDVDAAMDRIDPGGAGIGDDDAGGAQDRQTADDAEATVQRPLRELRAAGYRQLDNSVRGAAEQVGDLGKRRADHGARDGVDRRLPRRHRQAGARYRADASACPEDDAAVRRGEAYGRDDQGAMGDVRIVPGILDDAGAGVVQGRSRWSPGRSRGVRRPAAAPQRDQETPQSTAPQTPLGWRRRRRFPWSSRVARGDEIRPVAWQPVLWERRRSA